MGIFKIVILTIIIFISSTYADFNSAIELFNQKKYRQAYKLFVEEILNEKPQAFYYLGIMNEKGLGMDIDEKKAIEFYEKGAKLEDEKCLFILGIAYLNGLYNKPQNINKAISLLNKAEKKGNIQASLKLGEIYYYGFSTVMVNFEKALKYFKKCEKNNIKAKYYIGLMTLNGQGIKKDIKKGFNIIYRTAMDGEVSAQMEIGKIYMDGNILEKNYEASIKWFKKAAKEKIEEAAFYIGNIYSDKKYVNYNEIKSYSWHIVAARYGNSNSKALLDISRKKFSHKELELAYKMAEENIKEIFGYIRHKAEGSE